MADAAAQDDTAPADDEAGEDLHQIALERFHAICLAQQEERALCLQDRRFVTIAGAQWEGDWGDQFANSIMVEDNKVHLGVEKIIADYRANELTVEFRPVDENAADEETAETLNGLFLADANRSKGQQAFVGAFEEGVQGGMGAWRLCNEYVDEYDPDDDAQRISFKWIPDADQSVFWDMDARLYDKSDAMFCFVVSAMSPAAYKAQYGDDPASWPQDILKAYYDWYTPTVVRVAEYYRVVEVTKTRLSYENTLTGEPRKTWLEDMKPGERDDMKAQGWRQMGQKRVKRRQVEKYTMSAGKVLGEMQIIAGDQIPVVPYYGKRSFIDNMERVRGHVRFAKDQQRVLNAFVSKMVEIAAVTPIERPIFTPEQVAGHEQSWANANINRAPYSLVNPMVGLDGNPMPAGPVATLAPPQVPPVLAAMVQYASGSISETTTSRDTSDEAKSNVSAEAMDMAATRTDAKTFAYIDNMRLSMQRCGEIYLSMAKAVYVEEGRKVPTLTADNQHGSATLHQSTMDKDGALYVANDFNTTKLNVISDVTEATTTRRDKTVRAMIASAGAAAPFDPQLASAMLGAAMMNMDGEGIDDLKNWERQRLIAQGIVKPTDAEKKAMEEAAAQQSQKPDPQAQVAQAQVEKEQALTVKAQAQTETLKAQTTKALVEAHAAHHDAQATRAASPIEQAQKDEAHRVGILEKLTKMFAPKPQ